MIEPTTNGMVRRNFFVSDVLYKRMQARAIRTNLLVSEQLREAMADYMEKHEPINKG